MRTASEFFIVYGPMNRADCLLLRLFLHRLAENILDMQQRDGQGIHDVTDFAAILRELEEVALLSAGLSRK